MKHEKIIGKNLLNLKMRFDRLRNQHGKKKINISEALWDDVVKVAQVEGISTTATVLKLNYSRLKDRMPDTEPKPMSPEELTTFVPLQMPVSAKAKQGERVVIELISPRGNRMRIEADDSSQFNILGLAQALWRQESC